VTVTPNYQKDWTYFYTADDERIWQYNNITKKSRYRVRGVDNKPLREFLRDGYDLNQPYGAQGTWTWNEDWIWRDGTVLAASQPTRTVWFHLDHIGTTKVVSTNTGPGRYDTRHYYPFGEEATAQDSGFGDLIRFTGHERDVMFGERNSLDYMHARHYDSIPGRFLSVDPVVKTKLAMSEPQRWNRYSYAVNNPLKMVDPDGKVAVGFTGLFGDNPTSYIWHMNYLLRGTPGLGPRAVFNSDDISRAVAFVAAAYAKDPKQPVVLYGHSWGGSAALKAAEQLSTKGIPVDLLITFDAVGKYDDFTKGKLLVPPNVLTAINYYQTATMQLGNNRLEPSSELTNVFNVDVGNVSHTDVDNFMGPGAVGLIQSLSIEMLLERMQLMDTFWSTLPPKK